MPRSQSKWQEVLDWLTVMDSRIPAVFPPELPAESSPDFWFRVVQLEMVSRNALTAKVRLLINGSELPVMTPIEAWLYRRRVEWAAQLALAKAQAQVEPEASLIMILEWALVTTWDSDGCIALWNNAERGGQPHPDNPDGLSPG